MKKKKAAIKDNSVNEKSEKTVESKLVSTDNNRRIIDCTHDAAK